MKYLKNPISVRGDSLYCPLPVAIDAYWNCLVNCHHCYFRRLNATWGQELRPAQPSAILRQLRNGLKNTNPKSSLANALAKKKTIRIGNKTDPLQPVEDKHQVTKRIIAIMGQLSWSFVLQTRFTGRLLSYEELLRKSRPNLVLLPIISPGLSKDWTLLERMRTTPPRLRLRHCESFLKLGYQLGVNGEPFIPGFHTTTDFEDTLKLLKDHGIKRYNTYNFHFNAFVAKRLHAIGIDIEKIWYHNQDKQWKPILRQLIDLAKKYDILLGCPDFVNSGRYHFEEANTCCGIDVPNPCTYNTHTWKRNLLVWESTHDTLDADTWDGVGDREQGQRIIAGERGCDFYTLRDAGMIEEKKDAR